MDGERGKKATNDGSAFCFSMPCDERSRREVEERERGIFRREEEEEGESERGGRRNEVVRERLYRK